MVFLYLQQAKFGSALAPVLLLLVQKLWIPDNIPGFSLPGWLLGEAAARIDQKILASGEKVQTGLASAFVPPPLPEALRKTPAIGAPLALLFFERFEPANSYIKLLRNRSKKSPQLENEGKPA